MTPKFSSRDVPPRLRQPLTFGPAWLMLFAGTGWISGIATGWHYEACMASILLCLAFPLLSWFIVLLALSIPITVFRSSRAEELLNYYTFFAVTVMTSALFGLLASAPLALVAWLAQ